MNKTGSVQPTEQKRQQPKIRGEQWVELQAQVDAAPDATIAQYIEDWEHSHGVRDGQLKLSQRYAG
jgi:hypothetical protein